MTNGHHSIHAIKCWDYNWDAISPIFKFSASVRKVIYTTNAIESLDSTYRKLKRQRNVFPIDIALLKALYLATFSPLKNGLSPSETGLKSLTSCLSCTKARSRIRLWCQVLWLDMLTCTDSNIILTLLSYYHRIF